MDFKLFNWQKWLNMVSSEGARPISKPKWREARKERHWAVQAVQTVGAEGSLLVVGKDMP